MSDSILPVNNDVSGQNSFWIIHNNFREIKFTAGGYLTIDAVVTCRWTSQLLAVGFKRVLSSWVDITEKHCSATIGSLGIIMGF